jgi:deoxyribose-phosphate aldolase
LIEQKQRLAAVIDHTLLKPEATSSDIEQLCDEAMLYSFASVCVNPCWVPLAAHRLNGSPVRVCSVVGFPLGANDTRVKAYEARTAREQGAAEIDMVLNIGELRAGHHEAVRRDIGEVAHVARRDGGLLKVIIETCLLTDEEKVTACRLAVAAGADFVKTSTGFSKSGATTEDVRLMREIVGPDIGLKASGCIRTLASVRSMLEAGASRIGASAGVAIMKELEGREATSPAGNY